MVETHVLPKSAALAFKLTQQIYQQEINALVAQVLLEQKLEGQGWVVNPDTETISRTTGEAPTLTLEK
jgi:hypothetical protein